MSKTRRERRAEAIKAIKKALEDRGNYIDVFEVIDELYEIDYYDCTNAEDIEILLDLLSEDECTETMIDDFWRGCGKCGYVWEYMYGIGRGDGPRFCPRCGAEVMHE